MAPFDWILERISDSPWTYPLVAGTVLLDADLPVLPGETAIITAAIAAAEGGLVVWLVALAGFVGGVAGDSVSYWIGRRFGARLYFRVFGSERDRERYGWAEEKLGEHGSWVIPAARFVPGGRTAITLASGAVHVPWRSFLAADAAGVAIWAALYTALGYVGGETFEEKTWAAFAISLAAGALVALVGWGWYRLQDRGG